MEKFQFNQSPEVEKEKSYKLLKELFDVNFNFAKTFELQTDVGEYNQVESLGDKQLFWTELKDSETERVVEGKVYCHKDSKEFEEVTIICPGYKGDFALQERKYADLIVGLNKALVVLRHNGLRIKGRDMQNYVHCPERQANSNGQKYLGPENYQFSLLEANMEVLTAIQALSQKVKRINIIGQSWGGRIALESIVALNQKEDEKSRRLQSKIGNLILLGTWLEERPEVLESVSEYFGQEKEKEYFSGMDIKRISREVLLMGEKAKNIKASDLPSSINLFGLNSVGDSDIDFEEETVPFFSRMSRNKDKINKFGFIVLKSLEEYSRSFGGRFSESHDYDLDLPGIRGWMLKMLSS